MVIYKYVHPDRIDVLENGVIRFTQPTALNDPFETYPCFKSLEQSLRRRYQRVVDSFEGRAEFGATLILSLTLPNKVRQSISALQRDISVEICILSLTKKRNNLLMWSHYANSHRGFVLGFDSAHPFFQGKQHKLIMPVKDVKYSPKRRVMPPFEKVAASEELAEIFAYTKSDHWSYEDELRMVAHPSAADSVAKGGDGSKIYLYKFPSDCLKEIILGHLMPQGLRSKISQLVATQFPHAELFEARLNDSEFELDIVPFTNR